MAENNLVNKIINKIREDKLEPKPRWHFLLKNYVIYLSGALALIFGALGVSVIIYLLKYNNWSMGSLSEEGVWGYIILTMPYFWLIFLAIFIFVLYYNLKHLKRAYRYPLKVIILLAFFSSIVLGEAFYLLGFGEKLDEELGSKSPLYQEVLNPQVNFWFQPEAGRLVGLAHSTANGLELIDPSGEIWEIVARDELMSLPEIVAYEPLNIIGSIESDQVFKAQIIKSVRPGRAFMERPGRKFCPPGAPCEFRPGHLRNR